MRQRAKDCVGLILAVNGRHAIGRVEGTEEGATTQT